MAAALVRLFHRKKMASVRLYATGAELATRPEYPQVQDISKEGVKRMEREKWHERIRKLPTVEQKLYELNVPKYYGWRYFEMLGNIFPYDCLEFVRYATRTHLVNGLPGTALDEQGRHYVEMLRKPVMDALASERHNPAETESEEFARSSHTVEELNRVILSQLSSHFPHLRQSQVDYQPRVEAFWFLGSMDPDIPERRRRKQQKQDVDRKVDRPMQYFGCPLLQLRCDKPLPELIARDSPTSTESDVPIHSMDPRPYGYHLKHRHCTNVPGFWPGDPCEFGLLSFHPQHHIGTRSKWYGEHADNEEALRAQGILASFSWLLAQVGYQGFGTFTELTYPVTTQTVITDGATFSFFTYQMNTTLTHGDNAVDNPYRNVCWATDQMRLFDRIESGSVVGFNDATFANLLKMYINTPQERPGVQMRPYLSATQPHVADWEKEDLRAAFQKSFKHMYSNKPRRFPKPEAYQWEQIYKLRHRTRPQEAKRRFFELGKLGQWPGDKRYDDYGPTYLPKPLRTNRKDKWNRIYMYKEQF